MTVSVSDFRKNLFALLERAAKGELIEFTHRGRLFQLTPQRTSSKLSRLPKNDFLIGSLKEVEAAQKKLSRETQKIWERKWHRR